MDKNDLEKLKNLGKRLKQINSKFKLLNLLRLAKEEYEKNQYNDCIRTCNEALEINPNNPIALRGLGCSMQSLGDFDKAIYYYEKALLYSQNKEIEYTLLGTVYYLKNDLEKAIEYYNSAINENENYDSAYEGRNNAMLERHLKIADLQDELIRREIF